MHIQLVEKLEWLLTEDAFNIYQQCMYTHTYETYRNKVNDYISDRNTRIYICHVEDHIAGIIVLTLTGDESAELRGIAVHNSFQKQGIGSFMVRESADKMCIHRITAETDDDAVGLVLSAITVRWICKQESGDKGCETYGRNDNIRGARQGKPGRGPGH